MDLSRLLREAKGWDVVESDRVEDYVATFSDDCLSAVDPQLRLYVSDRRCAMDMLALAEEKIKLVINVDWDDRTPVEKDVYVHGNVQYKHLPMADDEKQRLSEVAEQVVQKIRGFRASDQEGGILLHCLAGMNRSIAIAACVMHRFQTDASSSDFKSVMADLHARRQFRMRLDYALQCNESFRAQVREWCAPKIK